MKASGVVRNIAAFSAGVVANEGNQQSVRPLSLSSSVSLGLTKSMVSFSSTQIAKSNLFQRDLSTFGETLRSGLTKLVRPV